MSVDVIASEQNDDSDAKRRQARAEARARASAAPALALAKARASLTAPKGTRARARVHCVASRFTGLSLLPLTSPHAANDDEFEHWRRLQEISLPRLKPNGCVARERFPHQGASDACVVCDPAASHWLRRAARIERRRGGVQGEYACVLRV